MLPATHGGIERLERRAASGRSSRRGIGGTSARGSTNTLRFPAFGEAGSEDEFDAVSSAVRQAPRVIGRQPSASTPGR